MSDKKRDKKNQKFKKENPRRSTPCTFEENLNMQMAETIAAIVEKETYPRGNNSNSTSQTSSSTQAEDDTQIYYSPKSKQRYEEDPYTVAQNYIDRVQFPY